MGALDMTEVARILDRDASGDHPSGGQLHPEGQPLVDVEHPAREAGRLLGVEEMPVVLHERPAAG